MPDWIEQLKLILPLLAVVAVGAGFYYTTNHRLDHLEGVVSSLKDDNDKLQQISSKLEEANSKLRDDVNRLRKTTNKKQDKRK